MTFSSEQELDDFLSQPTGEDIAYASQLEGDVVLLGAGGKMGPTLALRIRRALAAAGRSNKVYAISRFSDSRISDQLSSFDISVVSSDLLETRDLRKLPEAENVLFLAGRKFGSSGNEALTWAMNAVLPAKIAERYARSRIVALSSGNIYPFERTGSKGASESTLPAPLGEYAQSVLARERVFEYFSQRSGTPIVRIRLNYAVELRYGVLVDVAQKVFAGIPVDVTMPAFNAIWQGEANSIVFRSLDLATSPAEVLNLTGADTIFVRHVAEQFATRFNKPLKLTGEEAPTALLNDASRCHQLFGPPRIPLETLLDWTAEWISAGLPTLGKPTHFEARDGKF